MAILPPVQNVIRCAIRHIVGLDSDVINVFHCLASADGPYDVPTLTEVANAVGSAWETHVTPQLSNDVLFSDVTAKDLTIDDGAQGVSVFSQIGGVDVAALPASVSMLVSWKEGISYRGGHARTYLCGAPRDVQLDDQHFTADYTTTTQDNLNDFMTEVNAVTVPVPLTLSVVHYRLADTVQTPPVVQPILVGMAQSQFASQRRRNSRG